MIIVGVDLGSAHMGVAAVEGARLIGSATVDVDPKRLDLSVDAVMLAATSTGAELVALEWAARPYAPRGATPQQMAAIAFARETMAVLCDRIKQACAALAPPITTQEIAAVTWRARIGVTRRSWVGVSGFRQRAWAKLNPHRDTADYRVKVRIASIIGPNDVADAHQRDAIGVALGALPAQKPERVARIKVERVPKEHRAPKETRERKPPKPQYVCKHGGRHTSRRNQADDAFDALYARLQAEGKA